MTTALEHLRGGKDLERLRKRDLEQLLLGTDIAEVLGLLHIRSVTTVVGKNRHTICWIDTYGARQPQQIGRVGKCDAFERHRLEQARHLRLLGARWERVGRAPLHVWPVSTVLGEHRKTVEFADGRIAPRLGEQRECHGHREFVGREIFGHAGRIVATFHVGTVLTRLHHDLNAIGVVTQREGVDCGRIDLVEVLDHQPLEARQLGIGVVTEVEPLQPIVLALLVTRDRVEVFFDPRSERVVDETFEMLLHQTDHGKRCPCGHERLAFFPHVSTVLHRLDDACPRTGPTDTQLFEPLHDAGLGKASRWRSGVAVGGDGRDGDELADDQRG